jgi:error-prone DNA polymerase
MRPSTPALQLYEKLCQQILGFPRHLSIHNGGMILSREPLAQRVPIEPATMPDRSVVQGDKSMLEDVGIVKVDILSLRALQANAETVETVEQTTGTAIDLDKLEPTDPEVFKMIAEGDVIGISQMESGAEMNLAVQLRPENALDIEIITSVVRPGPILARTTHRLAARRLGYEAVSYPHPILEPILAKTEGVPIWHEQIVLIAEVMGQLTRGEGELLRRALGGKAGPKGVAQLREAFMAGALRQGISDEIATEVFQQIEAFGGYSFAHSHAAAMRKYIYAGAFLKRYYPAPYYCAILNAEPMGYWSPAVIVNDARRHGIQTLTVSIFQSKATCTLEGPHIRLGLRYVAHLAEKEIQAILAAREERTFNDLPDFLRRVTLPFTNLENLILIGAFDAWGISRRQLLWELGERYTRKGELPLGFATYDVELPALTRQEILHAEYTILGFSPGDDLMELFEDTIQTHGILGTKEFLAAPDKARVQVAGQKVMHRAPPTAHGVNFITLMDKDGLANVVVQPAVYKKYQIVLESTPLLVVTGKVQRKNGAINLIAWKIVSL